MATASIAKLSGARFPPESALLRDFTLPSDLQSETYRRDYDRNTIVYDCVWNERLRAHIINAPPFLNLWKVFRAGLKLDGAAPRIIKRHRHKRSEQIVIAGNRGSFSLEMGDQVFPLVCRSSEAEPFAGTNSVVALNRNNPLSWISAWAKFYVERHGAETVVIVDNGSTDYSTVDVAETLRMVPGLKHATVYDSPFPYGPVPGGARGYISGKFFQSAMLNLVRRDALDRAGAVLSVDIDELVDGPSGSTVFEAARKHPLGMVTIKGYYVYPESPDLIPASHGAHRYRAVPSKQCNRKWCIVPDRLMGRMFPWDPHQIGGALQNAFTEQKSYFHHHCYGCTTGWKNTRRSFDADLVRDPDLDALMDRYFGPAGS